MLKRNARVQRKRVKALTDPKPEFVSLVGAGANKTPFRALRADSIEQDIEITEEEVAARADDGFAVSRIEFSDDQFGDEETVVNWLAAGGYADAKVERTDAGYVVQGEADADAELIEVHGNGFTMYVTEMTPGALSQKSDEPTGPALLDMTVTLYSQLRESLQAGDQTAAKSALTEFSGMFDAFLETIPGTDEPTMKAFIDAVAPEVEMTKETTEQAAPVDAEVAVAGEDTTEVTTEGAEGEEIEAVAKTEGEEDATVEGEVVAEGEAVAEGEVVAEDENSEGEVAVAAKTEEEVADPMAALAALVGDLTKSVKELGETVSAKTDELAQRVAAVEDVRQTRKGADVDETMTSKSTVRSVSDEMAELRQRSMLGMRG